MWYSLNGYVYTDPEPDRTPYIFVDAVTLDKIMMSHVLLTMPKLERNDLHGQTDLSKKANSTVRQVLVCSIKLTKIQCCKYLLRTWHLVSKLWQGKTPVVE